LAIFSRSTDAVEAGLPRQLGSDIRHCDLLRIESISICPTPVLSYRLPAFTRGECQMRILQVTSPRWTPGRRRRVKSMATF
jgi:hypothetical protein